MKYGDIQKGDLVCFGGYVVEWGVVCSFVHRDNCWVVIHGYMLRRRGLMCCMFSGPVEEDITLHNENVDLWVFRGGKQIHPLPKVGKIGPQNENL